MITHRPGQIICDSEDEAHREAQRLKTATIIYSHAPGWDEEGPSAGWAYFVEPKASMIRIWETVIARYVNGVLQE